MGTDLERLLRRTDPTRRSSKVREIRLVYSVSTSEKMGTDLERMLRRADPARRSSNVLEIRLGYSVSARDYISMGTDSNSKGRRQSTRAEGTLLCGRSLSVCCRASQRRS